MSRPVPPSAAAVVVALATVSPVVALAAGWTGLLDGIVPILLAVVAGYAAGAWLGPREALVVAPLCALAFCVVSQLSDAPYHWLDDAVFYLSFVAGPAAAGRVVTVRAVQVARLRVLADELAETERLAVAAARLEEQARVQQRVHTGLTERLAAIAVRAEGAQRVGDVDSLAVLESEARGALDEVRDLLGSLADPPPAADPGAARTGRTGRTGWQVAPSPPPVPSRGDVVLAAVIGLGVAVEMVVHPLARCPAWAGALAGLLMAAPLVVRRSRPVVAVLAFLLVGAAATAWSTPVPAMVTSIALLSVLTYSLGAWSRSWWWVPTWAATVAAALLLERVSTTADVDDAGPAEDVMVVAWLATAVLLGRLAAGWQDRARRTADVVAALEAGREAATRLATARERQALASRLHDTVAHSMTVVCLQAAAGRRGATGASEALATIVTTAAAGVAELRDGLDVLAADDLLDATRIRAIARLVGVEATVSVMPATRSPEGAAGVLVHRVVREALVNVARHAPGATAVVTVTRHGPGWRVVATDTGKADGAAGVAGAGDLGAGSGLHGLARALEERGGGLTWGSSGDGFRVTAVVPDEVVATVGVG